MRDRLLRRVRRPIQYLDGEINAVRKAAAPGREIFALAFPDTYELGMSHQGLKILYHILNGREDISAERVFAPEEDMEAAMVAAGLKLATLESGTPLAACRFIGFTLQSELHYTNILNMLSLGGVPLRAADRGPEDPLVVGGGPQALNPEPLAEFFDAFALGDGEEVVLEMVEAHARWRAEGGNRSALLERWAAVPGVYVPSLYRVAYDGAGRIAGVEPLRPGVPPRVTRRIVGDLDLFPPPPAPPVPFMETTHDRLTVEVARGCRRGCRFCHAGMVYRPYRERSAGAVRDAVLDSLGKTGYEEVSLSSLSTGDYTGLAPLVRDLAAALKPRLISISLPSIRPGSLPDEVIKAIGAVRKSGFTIAPEAGTDRLRRVINKGITEEEILRTAADIFRRGWKSLKLYFMIGLPSETREDTDAIAVLAGRIKRVAHEAGAKGAQITVSVSSFVPKAHTPFQWAPMTPPEKLKETLDRLSRACRQAGIGFKWHHPEMSLIEGLLSRGDRRLSAVISRVWEAGGRSEAWTDHFQLSRWLEALAAEGLNAGFYTSRAREEGEVLPWDHLDTGVSRDFLVREYRRGLDGLETAPCRIGLCRDCGACIEAVPVENGAGPPVAAAAPPEARTAEDKRFKVRLKYRKEGAMKYLSHLDLFRAFYRAARRAGLPLSFTGGFNPHPRLSFAPPLPVGAEGEGELVDIELAAPIAAARVQEGLNAALPPGLKITAAIFLPRQSPALFDTVGAARWRITLPPEPGLSRADVARRLEEMLGRESLMVERKKDRGRKSKDVRPFILEAELAPGEGPLVLDLWLAHNDQGSIRPTEFLELLFPGDHPWVEDAALVRTALCRVVDGRPVDAFAPPRPAVNYI